MDMISDMPEAVLCHILSFLLTENAVATSILSRRWRHLWKHLQVFNFSDSIFDDNPTRFAPFVNYVLSRRSTRDILKFSISCYEFDVVDDMAMWIRDVVGPHLQELSVIFDVLVEDSLHLPLSVFTCTQLVSLSLIGSICVDGLQSICLPFLKTLDLHICYVDPADIFFSFSWCPILETLDINPSTIVNAPKIRAPSSLKRLTFSNITEIEDLDIDTPFLEYLDITVHNTMSHFSVTNLRNVVEAHLGFNREVETNFDFVLKLLRVLVKAQVLDLHLSAVEHLLYAPNIEFPEFECLLSLELCHPYAINPEFVLTLLQKCGMLQVLRLQVDPSQQWEEPWSLESWTQPINDPNCLTSHMIIFECQGYQGYESEQAFVAYLLQRGLVLKTVTIATYPSLDLKKKHDILKKLAIIPRASHMCQLDFE